MPQLADTSKAKHLFSTDKVNDLPTTITADAVVIVPYTIGLIPLPPITTYRTATIIDDVPTVVDLGIRNRPLLTDDELAYDFVKDEDALSGLIKESIA